MDFSWMDTAVLGLSGYAPAAQRGRVAGVATGVPTGLQGVIGFSNASAQYWATLEANGTYLSPLMKPGSYNVKLYQGELAVGSGEVTVQAGATTKLDLVATPFPSALFRIGEWDGTPAGFLDGEKIVMMHPSDARMSPLAPITFSVGVDPAAKFPALQLRKVNSPTTIKFDLTREQIAVHVLRIGITCAYSDARPQIKVNQWTPTRLPEASNQPRSRSFTIGTYRGNNSMFTYRIPASAFTVGSNTLVINPASGNGDLSSWLSAGWVYDAIQLDSEPSP
jgi:rhamnogalacturonan endolyase